MASRRYRGKSTLNGNIGHVNARLNVVEKMAAPKRLQEGAITTNYLAENAVTSTAIAPGSVGSAAIAESSITSPLLATNAVTGTKILDGAITDGKINSSGISGNKITSGTVDANYIGNLPASKITSGTIDAARLPAVTSDWADITNKPTEFTPADHDAAKVTSGTFDTARIPSITGSMMTNNTITATQMGAASVYGTLNAAGNTSRIEGNSIGQGDIGPNSIGNSELQDAAVGSANVSTAGKYGIVNDIINAGSGITKTTTVNAAVGISVNFGTTSTEVPTGNHTHTVSNVANGTLTRTTSIPSTLRIKKDIESYSPTNIKNLLNLEPKTYRYKRSERGFHQTLNKDLMHGYIVEELIDLGFTEPVGYNDEGNPASLDYGLMSMLVLELVKVQQAEIDQLKEEIQSLKDNK